MKQLSKFRTKSRTFAPGANAKSKYKNKKVEIDGIVFDSIKESERYLFLKEQQRLGIISNLRTHVTYELIPHQTYTVHKTKQLKTKLKEWDVERVLFKSIDFTPDFVYKHNGKTVAEDVKGSKFVVSRDFPIRQKLLYFCYNIYCNVVTKATAPIK